MHMFGRLFNGMEHSSGVGRHEGIPVESVAAVVNQINAGTTLVGVTLVAQISVV